MPDPSPSATRQIYNQKAREQIQIYDATSSCCNNELRKLHLAKFRTVAHPFVALQTLATGLGRIVP